MGVQSKISEHDKDNAVKQYASGNVPVTAIAKQYKVSVPAVYLWIKAAREGMSKQITAREKAGLQADGSSRKAHTESNTEIKLMLQEQAAQIDALKRKLFELMVKHGEL